MQFGEHLLTIIIFTPVLFALVALLLDERKAKWVCTLGALATFLAVIPLCLDYGHALPLKDQFEQSIRPKIIEKHLDHSLPRGADRGFSQQLIELATATDDPAPAIVKKIDDAGLASLYKATAAEMKEMRVASTGHMSEVMRFVEYGDWIPTLGIHYFLGVDGLSLPLMFLTALLSLLCLVYSWNFDQDKDPEERRPLKGFFILFLILEAGLLGVFVALDMFLFYVFWEIVLLPSYFLIGIWGGKNRNYAALKLFIYTLAGSVAMLIAMIALYFKADPHTFNMLALLEYSAGFSRQFQFWIFLATFIGFAIKVPVFPFHTWLPDAHVQAPTAFSVMLAGVMLKMGGYGFFRLAYPLCPDAATSNLFVYGVALLGVINIVYGAFVALGQSDFKSLVAYSSVSHMGYCLLGLSALTLGGMTGGALQMFNHGVSSAMCFFLVGVIYDRAHHRDLDNFGGIALQMPWYFGLSIVGFFASLGLPGLNGFISEFLVFFGVYQSSVVPKWMLISAVPGIVLTAVYILWTLKRVFLGDLTNEKYKKFPDITFHESFALWPLGIMCIVVGVYPRIILDVMEPSMKAILALTLR